jgi:tellurite resistance protein TehA-like permease
MATGIVSIGLTLVERETLSRVLLGVGIALWLGLCAVFAGRAVFSRARWIAEARSPAALTAVAGTAVLGSRLALLGVHVAAYGLLAVALCLWAGLLGPVLRHWSTPTVGVSFVLAVATESLAVLAALLAREQRIAWLAFAALALLAFGLLAYVFVLVRFDLRQLLIGHGDHWIVGGALAIATLACARAAAATGASPSLGGLRQGLVDASVVLWAAAACWLPLLVATELVAPRLLSDTRRWATVFPAGMYAVCSIAVGDVAGVGRLVTFGRIWIWVALALWALVLARTIRCGAAIARGSADQH